MKNNTLNNPLPPTYSERRLHLILIVILGLYPLVGMGIDLIAPSLPAISRDLNTSTTFSKNLITFFLLGFMCGNFMIGTLSDVVGRRKPMLFAFLVFILASILPAIFNEPYILLASRFFQGVSIAGYSVNGRAVLADVLPREKLLHFATLIATMWGIGPIIGPVIGGYLQFYFNWQMCFYFFAFMGLLGFLALFFIVPETHFRRQPLQYQQLKNNFIMIVSHKIFLGLVIIMGITYSGLIVFNTLGPFLIQDTLGYSPVYFGHIALLMGCVFLVGTMLCRRLLKEFDSEDIFFFSVVFFTIVSALSVLVALIVGNDVWVIIIPSIFMFLGCGIIYPTSMGKCLSLFTNLAGSVSAVMNLISMIITSLIAFIMSWIHADKALIIIAIYLGLMLTSCMFYYFLIRSGNKAIT